MQNKQARRELRSYLEENNLINLFPGVVPGYALRSRKWECVAAYTKRPLYPITCGDIGHVPETVESRTAAVDFVGTSSDYVGLVFLRILEYYPGILFLTTNRVGAIDDAFRSRLHLTLYYPKLVEKQSTKIWKNNIRKLEQVNELRVKKGQQPIKYDKDEIVKWAKVNWESLQWNGRQIRNAFQTAIALAEFKAQSKGRARRTGNDSSSPTPRSPKRPVLSQDTFMLIAEASTQFNDYLLQTHGQDEDTTASRDQIRPATFKENKTRIKRVQESSDSDTDSDSTSSSSGSSHDSDSLASDSELAENASDGSDVSEPDSEVEKKLKKSAKRRKKRDDKTATKDKRASVGRKGVQKKKRKPEI
ncbi:hypothetical protein K4K59_011887 [Colletotrichum sp. SAR11_240]|nr:hypothetical protein K4K59_011887 [Colletotrichum sp. SAR11_240]